MTTNNSSAASKLKDIRSTPIPRSQLATMTQSLIYELFSDDEKLTMNEITDLVTKAQRELNQQPVVERTIRRAVEKLITAGFLKKFGRQGSALLYGKVDASFAKSNQELVTLAGQLVSVKDFLEIMASPDDDPLSVKHPMLSDQMQTHIRRRLVWVLLTAGEAGHDDQLKRVNSDLFVFIRELEHVLQILKTFVDSPIWYAHYRDRIAYEIRKVREENPDLVSLAADYAKGG